MHLLATPANNRSGNTHLDPGPVGIDAYSAWSKSNGKGEDVSVIDLETGWILTHTDLPGPQLLFNDNESNQHKQRDHGAAVMGIIGAKDNGTGVTGDRSQPGIPERCFTLRTSYQYPLPCGGRDRGSDELPSRSGISWLWRLRAIPTTVQSLPDGISMPRITMRFAGPLLQALSLSKRLAIHTLIWTLLFRFPWTRVR